MINTIKIKAGNLEEAREKFRNEIPEKVYILNKHEFNAFDSNTTQWYVGESTEEAIKKAQDDFGDPFRIKGEISIELEEGTHMYIPINIQAYDEYLAEKNVESYIKDKYFRNKGAAFKITNTVLTKKGSKGLMGIGKAENSYQVTAYIKPRIRLKYNTWAVIEAEITDDINIASEKMIKEMDFDIVKYLIEQGIDINYCDEKGRNKLFYVYSHPNSNADWRYEKGKWLIDNGIDFKKCDHAGDNILTCYLRNNRHLDPFGGDKLKEFLEKNGIKEDKTLVEEILEAESRAKEDRKIFCPRCNKKVNTVEETHYYDDGWRVETTWQCEICGTVLDTYSGQA